MQVNRTENKIIINRAEQLRICSRLRQLMPVDQYSASPDGYEIRSLYFDTLTDRCCAEKEDGLRFHDKIRIRIYGTDDHVIKLECKQKDGPYQVKHSMLISRSLMDELIAGHYEALLKVDDPMNLFFYHKLCQAMMPKVIIQYQRLAFALDINETRITFDSDIRATEANFDLFQNPLLAHPIMPMDQVIMEVKFNHFLPGYLKNALRDVRKSPTSYSKYFNGRSFYRRMV